MAAPIVQAEYDKLEGIAGRFEGRSVEANQMLQAINRAAERLRGGGWEGRGIEAFDAEMTNEVLPALARLVEALSEGSTATLEIAQLIREAEEEAARLFQAEDSTIDLDIGGNFGGGAGGGEAGGGGGGGNARVIPVRAEASVEENNDDGGWWGKWGEWVHGGLDVVGLVPGLGEVADGLNGVIYLAEGRKLEAGLSFGAMIPIAGWGATAGKVGVRVGREVLEEGVEAGAERIAREGAESIAERGAREGADDAASGINRIPDDPPASITVASGHKSVRDPSFLKFDELAPNTSYTRNEYDYVTDGNGRVTQAGGELRLDADAPRYRSYETKIGDEGLDTDHGGHIVGNRFGASSEGVNLVPQNGNFNTGAYNQLEKQWADAIRDGKKVEVNIDLRYPESSNRPSAYSIEYTITDPSTGEAVIKRRTFRNRPGGT